MLFSILTRLHYDMNFAEGCKEAAEKFALEAGFKAPAELERLDERIKIWDAIQAGKIQEATALEALKFAQVNSTCLSHLHIIFIPRFSIKIGTFS